MGSDYKFPLYDQDNESRSHLFFLYDISPHQAKASQMARYQQKHKTVGRWTTMVPNYAKERSSRAEVHRLNLAAAVYHIWRVKNLRMMCGTLMLWSNTSHVTLSKGNVTDKHYQRGRELVIL